MNDLVAVIPARSGSKGRPGKNVAVLAGKPLWRWSLEQARQAGAGSVLVTTDIAEILHAPLEVGLHVLQRPAELADDMTPMAPVLLHALRDVALAGKTIVLLQPTSPLRSVDDIRTSVDRFRDGRHDLVMTVAETERGVLKYGTLDGERFDALRDPADCFTNRQSLPRVFRPTGAVYVFGRDWFLENGGFETDRIGAVVQPEDRADDIDTQDDMDHAEAVLAAREV